MSLPRLGCGTRLHCSSFVRSSSRLCSSLIGGGHHVRATTRAASLRSPAVHARPQSPHQTYRQLAKAQKTHQNAFGSTVLQSAFPKKTFAFLVILTGLAYYSVDIRDRDWTDDVMNNFGQDSGKALPLQFFGNKEELDHFLQHQIHDPSEPLRNPQVAQLMIEHFGKLVAGEWMLTEKDAVEEDMPITHGCLFKSNDPCEDYFALGTSPGPGSQPWNYWSIMDGHAGRHTAFYLQGTLIPSLSSALLTLPSHSSPFEIESTIKNTFRRIDKQILDSARTAANWFPAANIAAVIPLRYASSGSCALLAAFDPANSTLRVACTGDSRAVLGRWDASAKSYTTIPLSDDQTGFNEAEVRRLAEEHPDEPDIIDSKSGRLMGIAVTRAFGDLRWKWDNEFIKTVQAKFWGSSPRPNSKTPPYMTAEPEITETQVIRAEKDDVRQKSDFMIMASDGLWDRISSEHAVECVERWLEAKDRGNGEVRKDPKLQIDPSQFENSTSVEPSITYDAETGEQVDWKATPEYFAIEDENAAVCLLKNAMGGNRRGLLTALMLVGAPTGRSAIDDTTVMVVFFDKLNKEGVARQATSRGAGGDGKSWWKFW